MTRRAPVDEAVEAIRAGRLIVIPTDTVYGIAARPDDPVATAALFAAKGRPGDLTLPVLADGVLTARGLAVFDERAVSAAVGSISIILGLYWAYPLIARL